MTPEEKKAAEEAKVAEEAKRAKEIETAKAEALEAGRKTENARQTEIRAVAAKLGLGDADMTPLLSDPAVTLEAARATLIDKRAEADKATRIDGHLDMGRADSEKRHEAMAEGLSLRAAYRFGQRKAEKPPEIARDFMYGSLESLARAYLRGIGISQVDSMPTTLIFDVALNFDKRFHSTSDFPLILADAINKNLRAAMAGEALNFEAISTQRNFRDFKLVHELKMGTFTSLALIPEGGNVTYGTIGEGDETWRGFSYGQGWKQTRESMINDDLEAFSRIPAEMLLCINTLKLDLWWSLVTTNAALADTIALFHANHANLAAGADIGAPAAATLGAMREAFRLQTKLGGQRLNLMPSHLIIPANHETAVEQLVTPVSISGFSPAASNVVIPRFVGSLAIIVEPRLDTSSTTRWYAFSRDYIGGSFVHGTLEGAEEPSMLSETDFETRGLKMRVDLDFGCGVTDHRAVYANNGV